MSSSSLLNFPCSTKVEEGIVRSGVTTWHATLTSANINLMNINVLVIFKKPKKILNKS